MVKDKYTVVEHSRLRSRISPLLTEEAFQPNAYRVVSILLHYLLIAISILVLGLKSETFPFLWFFASIVIGNSMASLAIIGHEVGHSSVVRPEILQKIIGFLCFAPVFLSFNFWICWHNKIHHRYNNWQSRDFTPVPHIGFTRAKKTFLNLGTSTLKTVVAFLFYSVYLGLYLQIAQFILPWKHPLFRKFSKLGIFVDQTILLICCGLLFYFSDMQSILKIYLPAYAVQSLIINAYFITNHHPNLIWPQGHWIENACSLRLPKIIKFIHCNVGLHVEHHLFPEINPSKLATVQKILLKDYPDRYLLLDSKDAFAKIFLGGLTGAAARSTGSDAKNDQ